MPQRDKEDFAPAGSGEFTQIFGALPQAPAAPEVGVEASSDRNAATYPGSPAQLNPDRSQAAEAPVARGPESAFEAAHSAPASDAGFTALFSALQPHPESTAAEERSGETFQASSQRYDQRPDTRSPETSFASNQATQTRPAGGIFAADPVQAGPASTTQIFAASAQTPAAGVGLGADETQLFPGAVRPSSQPARDASPFSPLVTTAKPLHSVVPTPSAQPMAAASPRKDKQPEPDAGEFTQVFRPIAPPQKLAPPAKPTVAPPVGEFTQFFSAVSAREASSPVSSSATPSSAPASRTTPAASLSPTTARPEAPSAAPAAQAPQTSPAEEPGAFTRLFSQAIPAPAQADAPPLGSAPPRAASPAPRSFANNPTHAATDPIFGAQPPQGTFTDAFAPASPFTPAAGAQQQSAASGGLTELFRAPSSGQGFAAAAPHPQASPHFADAHAASGPSTAAASQGEFTRLMQSLEQPAKPAPFVPAAAPASTPFSPPASLATPPPLDAAFFAPTPSGQSGDGEYTRVMRGGAPAHPGVSGSATPQPGTSQAPGLSLAPAAKAESKAADTSKDDKAAKEKPRTLVILLVVMNVLLLLALAALAIYLLRRK